MTRSERISLIEELVTALSEMRTEIADLILAEFDLPTSRSWESNPEDYFISMLRQGTDETLQEIAAHLDVPPLTLPIDPKATQRLWTSGYCRCFFSHTSTHKSHAALFKVALEPYGCDVFVAHEDIAPTLEWLREIESALSSCHCLLALITDDFHGSLWTDQEIGFALGRGIPVIAIRAGKDPYGLMGKLQAVSFKEDALGETAEAIFTALNSKAQTAVLVASGAVNAFLESPNFASAKTRMGIVERLASLTPELRQLLVGAENANNQIRGSFGVPDRLRNLVKARK